MFGMEEMISIKTYLDGILDLNVIEKLVLFLIFSCSIHWLNVKRRNYKFPPGPTGIPLVGYLPFLGRDPFITLNNLAKKYGNVFSLYLGRSYTVVLNDWDSVKDTLSQPVILDRPAALFNAIPYGLGFNAMNGSEWAEQRKFVIRAMKDIGLGRPRWEKMLQEEVIETTNRIQKNIGEVLDMGQLFSTTFISNVMALAFGHRFPHGDPALVSVAESMESILKNSPFLALNHFLPRLSSLLTKIGVYGSPEKLQESQEFSEGVWGCIKHNLRSPEIEDQESFVKKYVEEIRISKENNLKNGFTEHSLRGNTQVLLIGGSETTKNAFIWLLIAMAQNPEIQCRVHKELDNVLGKDGTIEWSERAKIPYSFACIMESLRWKTLVPINTLRVVTQDTTVLGYRIPKGATIVSNLWALHNDSKYWPDPDRFDPERFLLPGGQRVKFRTDSYIPFSFGKRNCPGEMIAMMGLLKFFTALMQQFKVIPQDGDTVMFGTDLGITFEPTNVKLRFVPRE